MINGIKTERKTRLNETEVCVGKHLPDAFRTQNDEIRRCFITVAIHFFALE
jgi:hypothetical protein